MNKYYSFISLSFSSESFINTIQRNVNIQSKKKKDTANWSKRQCSRWSEIFICKSKCCLMTYHSKKSSSLKTNLWNSLYTLWKSEIINRKEPLRYLKNPNIVYSEPHARYNCLLHSTNTRDTSYKNETTIIFRWKRKKILLHLILPKKQAFFWKQSINVYVNAVQYFSI